MSDKADLIFRKLIAIQVSNNGEIPPDLGVKAIRDELGEPIQYFVAKSKHSEAYACDGHETGMGKTIEHVGLSNAKKVPSPAGIMAWMGGHYRGYDAIPITEYKFVGDAEPYPPEDEVWPE